MRRGTDTGAGTHIYAYEANAWPNVQLVQYLRNACVYVCVYAQQNTYQHKLLEEAKREYKRKVNTELGAEKPALLTQPESSTKTLLFGLMVSLVSGICRSSGKTDAHTHTHTQMVAFGWSHAGVLGRGGWEVRLVTDVSVATGT